MLICKVAENSNVLEMKMKMMKIFCALQQNNWLRQPSLQSNTWENKPSGNHRPYWQTTDVKIYCQKR